MALTLKDQIALARDPRFLDQVQQALVVVAGTISAEVNATPNHDNRARLSNQVKNSPEQYVTRFAYGVATDPAINSVDPTIVTDTLVVLAVKAEWDAIAGDDSFHDRVLNTFILIALNVLQNTPSTGATAAQIKAATIANKFLNGQEGFLVSMLQPLSIQFTTVVPTDVQLATAAQALFASYTNAPVTS